MLNASGYKAWPKEVEDVIYSHPAVREAQNSHRKDHAQVFALAQRSGPRRSRGPLRRDMAGRDVGALRLFHTRMEMLSRRAYGFRNFENYRMRVLAQCGWNGTFACRIAKSVSPCIHPEQKACIETSMRIDCSKASPSAASVAQKIDSEMALNRVPVAVAGRKKSRNTKFSAFFNHLWTLVDVHRKNPWSGKRAPG